MTLLVISLCKDKLHEDEFVNPICKIVKSNNQKYTTHSIFKDEKINLKNISKVIICGTSLKDFKYEEHTEKLKFLKETNLPIFTICAGSQNLAKLFGAKIYPDRKIGMEKAELVKNDKILKNIQKENIKIYSLHQKAFSLPSNFHTILKTKKTPQLIKHNTKPIYAALFHPEVRNEKIIKNFINTKAKLLKSVKSKRRSKYIN